MLMKRCSRIVPEVWNFSPDEFFREPLYANFKMNCHGNMLAKDEVTLAKCQPVMAGKSNDGGSFSKRINPAFMTRLFFIALILSELPLHAAMTVPDSLSKLGTVSPFPAVAAAAQANQIPLQPFDPPAGADSKVVPGDSVTALVTLSQKGALQTQWLLYLQAVEPGPNDKAGKPPAPAVYFSSCGNKFDFVPEPAFVSLRSIGPFTESRSDRKSPVLQDKTARFTVDQGFLGIGLDRAAAALQRTVRTGTAGGFDFSDKPFSTAQTQQSRILAQTVHLTSDEERALSGMIPALTSYFEIVQQTGGLNDAFLKIVNTPSVWSMVWNAGVQTSMVVQSDRVAPVEAAIWGLPPHTPVYSFPMLFELNNDSAFNVTFVVTAPRSPLLACGGVIGLLAEKAADKDTYLTLRIVSAHSSSVKTICQATRGFHSK
jgi:hypothetical protein